MIKYVKTPEYIIIVDKEYLHRYIGQYYDFTRQRGGYGSIDKTNKDIKSNRIEDLLFTYICCNDNKYNMYGVVRMPHLNKNRPVLKMNRLGEWELLK